MINKVILVGNCGSEPEIRTLENGTMVARVGVATNENYQDKSGEWQTQTEWHDVIMWRNMAERAQATIKKGSQIYVEGKLTHRSWEDQNGNKRKTTEIVANTFRLLGKKDERSGGDSGRLPTEESPYAEMAGGGNNRDLETPKPPTTTNPTSTAAAEDDLPF